MRSSQSSFPRVLILALTLLCLCKGAIAQPTEYEITRDVVFGTGIVNVSTQPLSRDLFLDAYIPRASDSEAPTPAVILAFGGAFHRGEKGDFQFSEDGASDSSMADYCSALARRGFACFSIDYRLVPEDPVLPSDLDAGKLMPKALLKNPAITSRIEFVRQKMGLASLDEKSREQLWNGTFAAVQDMETALSFVRANAQQFHVAPNKIAVGGFSAGAITAMNLAYGEQADVQAVIALSGTSWGYDLNKTLTTDAPPLLMFAGQWDLQGIRLGSASIANLFQSRDAPVTQAWVPGFGHFYPMEAPSLATQFNQASVIDRITNFLNAVFKASTN
ncbi:MAG: alpha/beta hydrolase [Halieaceae bacterium]|nr:alpha/beta hydrolase [Halieaceae bacterium]